MAASQRYEQSSQQYEAYCTEEKLDFWRHHRLTIQCLYKLSGKRRFCQPQSENDIQAMRSHTYRRRHYKTLSAWAQSFWREWATHRLEQPLNAVSPFAKPLSIPGIHFGSATNFTTNPELWTVGQFKPVCYCCYFALLVLLGFV